MKLGNIVVVVVVVVKNQEECCWRGHRRQSRDMHHPSDRVLRRTSRLGVFVEWRRSEQAYCWSCFSASCVRIWASVPVAARKGSLLAWGLRIRVVSLPVVGREWPLGSTPA